MNEVFWLRKLELYLDVFGVGFCALSLFVDGYSGIVLAGFGVLMLLCAFVCYLIHRGRSL